MAEAGGGGGGWFDCITSADQEKSVAILRWTNLFNAGFVVFAGIYSMTTLSNVITLHFSAIAVGCYLFCFGCVLCCYEIRLSALEKRVRRRFGFMYTFVGRTLFLLFVASLCFSQSGWATIVAGAITAANAILNFFVMYKFGEYTSDPTSKYTTAEAGASRYVQENPDLARAAVGGAASYAANNPDVMEAGVNYARNNPDHAVAVAQAAGGSQQSSSGTASNPFAMSSS